MREVFRPIQPGNLKDAAYQKIRAAILSGQIPAGTRLLEVELAESMQVSRAPVREALAHLQQEGLVVSRPNRGTYVAEIFSQQDVDEITTLRSALESLAVSIAAAKITPAELDDLADVVNQMQAAADRNDLALLADLDFQFHARLVRSAEHNRLFQTWAILAAQYWALYLTGLLNIDPGDVGYLENVSRVHQPIVDALRARKADLAMMYLQYNIIEGTTRLDLRLPERTDSGEDALAAADGNGRRRPNRVREVSEA